MRARYETHTTSPFYVTVWPVEKNTAFPDGLRGLSKY